MDTPETLAAAFLKAAAAAPAVTVAVVGKGAQNVKSEGISNAMRSAPVHNAGAPRTITYDSPRPGLVVESEIGYDKRAGRAASLGNLLEYGGGGDHSPPHRDLGRALDAEEDRFGDALAKAIEKLL